MVGDSSLCHGVVMSSVVMWSCLIWSVKNRNKNVKKTFFANLFVFFQGFGLPEWEEQVTSGCVTSSGGGHPLSSGSHFLLSSSWGGTGAWGEADQTSLPPQPAEPLPRGGDLHAACTASPTLRLSMSIDFYWLGLLLRYICYAKGNLHFWHHWRLLCPHVGLFNYLILFL